MPNRDPRIDTYISRAPDYAKPILKHLRKLIHEAVPEVTETVKWHFPTFEHHGIMCGLAAFKSYATFGFWKGKLLVERGFPEAGDYGMGQSGKLTSMEDLPADRVLIRLIREAAKLNEQGIKIERAKSAKKPPVKPPTYFMAAVRSNTKALANFQAFSPTKKRDYVEWIAGAKSEDTRDRRLTQAVSWIAEGKSRNWKYERATR
jgi:hypothetical protein